ncbi:MAG TPA: pentapeptide repeat-containing protein [Streptosporangiaceae bacterium]
MSGAITAAAAQAVTCPAVDPVTHVVTPAPQPGVDWADCDLAGAELAGADLSASDLAGADLTGADLTGANLTGDPLQRAELTGANLTSAVLASTNMLEATLTGATVTDADLTGSRLTGVVSGQVVGQPEAGTFPADWSLSNGYFIGPTATLTDAELAGADLGSADLSNARIGGADLTGANLTNANLDNVQGAANFTDANLAGADLEVANVSGSTFTGATITGANLSAAFLPGVISGGVTGPASLPDFWQLVGGYLIGQGTNLTGADLAGQDLPGGDLNDANLTNADFTNADLNGADLYSSTVSGAQFTGADLAGVQACDLTGTPASLPAPWVLRDDCLFGPGVLILENATNMSGFDLSGLDLAGGQLNETDFDTTNFDDTNLTGVIAFESSFTSADFSNADLTGVQASGSNFTDANFSDADLTNAAFTNGTNLTGATFTGATLTGVTTAVDVICPDGTTAVQHIDGCFSPLDTTPPAVTVTGIASGHVYPLGRVPKAGCKTTDRFSTVTTAATVRVTGKASGGVGTFTATCSGAQDAAGNMAAPVSVTYKVSYGLAGFISPARGSTVARSSRSVAVVFSLHGASGAPITGTVGSALAKARHVRVILRGPGIKPVTAYCAWVSSGRDFRCSVPIPGGVRSGASKQYTISAYVYATDTGWVDAPAEPGKINPDVIHFR